MLSGPVLWSRGGHRLGPASLGVDNIPGADCKLGRSHCPPGQGVYCGPSTASEVFLIFTTQLYQYLSGFFSISTS